MSKKITISRTAAVFFLRTLLGLIFSMQGYGKVITWGITDVYICFFQSFETELPRILLKFTAYYTSYIELAGGVLLLIGFKTRWALYALASVLLIVSFGHGLESPIWDLQHVMYRAMLLAGVLLLPEAWDRWSLDAMLNK